MAGANGGALGNGRMKENLLRLWGTEKDTPLEVRVSMLLELLDSIEGSNLAYGAATTNSKNGTLNVPAVPLPTAFLARYNKLEAKLNARVPIAKVCIIYYTYFFVLIYILFYAGDSTKAIC